jgi:HTH-type transcriptional repressor of NAD biosynthesis genes
MKNLYKTGLVLGKFMPPHKGHQFLFQFADQYCEQLTIVVDCLDGQTLDPLIRRDWVAQIMPHANVVALTNNMPQNPEDIENFWVIWKEALITANGGKPDVLIASSDYGWKLSQVLECDFIPCDISRVSIPISATEIRDNPMKYWDYLIDPAKPYFMKKICFVGPESTGKTTISQLMAKEYKTVYVPEYAASVINQQNGNFFSHNVEQVAIAQTRTETALTHMANKIMMCDTDVITTMVWSEILFGSYPPVLDSLIKNNHYDMTFLFSPDVPWIDDSHRKVLQNSENSETRMLFFNKIKAKLEFYDREYIVVSGNYVNRQNIVKEQIDNVINNCCIPNVKIKKKI